MTGPELKDQLPLSPLGATRHDNHDQVGETSFEVTRMMTDTKSA